MGSARTEVSNHLCSLFIAFLSFFSPIILLNLNIFTAMKPNNRNMGPYSYVNPRIMTATREINGKEMRPRYVGRAVSAAPATGMSLVHQVEYNEILNGVFGPADQ